MSFGDLDISPLCVSTLHQRDKYSLQLRLKHIRSWEDFQYNGIGATVGSEMAQCSPSVFGRYMQFPHFFTCWFPCWDYRKVLAVTVKKISNSVGQRNWTETTRSLKALLTTEKIVVWINVQILCHPEVQGLVLVISWVISSSYFLTYFLPHTYLFFSSQMPKSFALRIQGCGQNHCHAFWSAPSVFPEEKGQTQSKAAHVETLHRQQTWIIVLLLFLLSETDSSTSCSILCLHFKEKQNMKERNNSNSGRMY